MEFVSPFLINVLNMMLQELAHLVLKDTISSMEFVNSHHSTMLNLQIQDVDHGIGTIKFVLPVLKDGHSMLIKFVLQLVIFVLPMMQLQEFVFLVSRDTIWLTEFVNSQLSTMLSLLMLDALLGTGIIKFVLNVQRTGSRMLMEFVFKFLTIVPLMMLMVPVLLVSRDMIWLTEFVNSHHSTMLSQLTQDVPLGIGTIRYVLNVLKNGSLMLIKFVLPFPISVLLTMPMELVFLASRDMISSTEFANSQLSTMLSHQILDVPPGIGIIKSALPAQRTGSRMLTVFVLLSLTNALSMMLQELVPHASVDMILLMESVNSLHSTTLNLPTQDVLNGTGTIKFVLNAQNIGSSMLMEFVSQFLTNVLLMMPMEPVFHVIRDTILSTEFVNSHHSTTLNQLMQDVDHGIGITKSVLPAQKDGSSTPKTSVLQSVTNVKNTIILDSALHVTKDTT